MGLDELWKVFPKLDTTQLLFVFVILVVFGGMYLWRHANVSGTDKLAAEQSERSEAIKVLEGQIALFREERHHLEKRYMEERTEQNERIKALESQALKDARYEQDYRHALSNRAQAFLLAFGVAHELLIRVVDAWHEIPNELKHDIESLPKASDIDRNNPLPHREH